MSNGLLANVSEGIEIEDKETPEEPSTVGSWSSSVNIKVVGSDSAIDYDGSEVADGVRSSMRTQTPTASSSTPVTTWTTSSPSTRQANWHNKLYLAVQTDPDTASRSDGPSVTSVRCSPSLDGAAGTPGCTDESACNYDSAATEDAVLVTSRLQGCTDENACNYDADATIDDGSCAARLVRRLRRR